MEHGSINCAGSAGGTNALNVWSIGLAVASGGGGGGIGIVSSFSSNISVNIAVNRW